MVSCTQDARACGRVVECSSVSRFTWVRCGRKGAQAGHGFVTGCERCRCLGRGTCFRMGRIVAPTMIAGNVRLDGRIAGLEQPIELCDVILYRPWRLKMSGTKVGAIWATRAVKRTGKKVEQWWIDFKL